MEWKRALPNAALNQVLNLRCFKASDKVTGNRLPKHALQLRFEVLKRDPNEVLE